MDVLTLNIVGFIVCTIVIVFSGTRLARYGDQISKLTGWGKAWIGLIMMASVTSLPELVTGISSVTIVDEPGLAAGDVFGSCMFNLLILSLVDARIKRPLTSLVKSSHIFAGLFGIILLATSAIAIFYGNSVPQIMWISPFSFILIGVYFLAIWGIFRFEKSFDKEKKDQEKDIVNGAELRNVLTAYFLNAILVIVAALFLPFLAENIIHQTGIGIPFFGTLFLAASTSLPELVVSFAAIRIKAYDLLVGNLLGSNIFNIFILAIDDIFYTGGSLYADINIAHLQTVIVVIIMTAIVGLGLMVKPTRKFWRLSFDALLIFILYVGLMITLYFQG